MPKSDWLLVALNTGTLIMAVVGLVAQHPEPMSVALGLALTAALINSAVVIRRGGRREPAPPPRQRALPAHDADLDARRILDIDARLDALERAEERRLRMQEVEQVPPASGPGAPRANGRSQAR